TATTSEGNLYEVTAKQAVLEDHIPAGPIYQHFYFTTPPYPINTYDEVGLSSALSGVLLINPPIDLISVTSSLVDGELRDIRRYYTDWPPEGFSVSSDILSGELREILQTYTMQPEGVSITSNIQTGTL